MIQKILIANWKMNPSSLAQAKALVTEIKKASKVFGESLVVIAPPTIYLGEVQKIIAKSKLLLGAQNVSAEKEGAQTGETSAGMLKDAKVEYIIIGHSERRAKGESDEVINRKVIAVTDLAMTAVLCIGERIRDDEGQYFEFLHGQIKSGLKKLSPKMTKSLVIAYEPIWAIGKDAKRAVRKEELHEMTIFIRKALLELYGKSLAYKIPVIYGGSVDLNNVGDFLHGGMVDGFLIGRASLDAKVFTEMVAITKSSGSPKIVKV